MFTEAWDRYGRFAEQRPASVIRPPYTVEQGDATVTERWDVPSPTYRRHEYDVLVEERRFTDVENALAERCATDGTRRANREKLLLRARTALVNNAAYLDKVQAGTATNTDHITQVPALTRQMQAVIRLLVGSDLLDSTGG